MTKLLFVLVATIAVFGCERRTSQHELQFDLVGFDAKIQQRFDHIWKSAGLDQALDTFAAAVVEDPGLATSANLLFARLSADPKIAGQAEKIIDQIASSPRVQVVIAQLMAEHPGEEVGALAGKRVGQAWEQPAVSKGFEVAFGELLHQLDVNGELVVLSHAVEGRVERLFSDPKRTEAWSQRLIDLNGGTTPDPKQATKLYLEHAWSEPRLAKFLTLAFASRTLRTETAGFLADVLAIDAIRTELAASAAVLVADPTLQTAASGLILQLLEATPDVAKVAADQRTFLASPVMVQQAQHLLHVILSEPRIAAITSTHLDRLAADPQLRAAFDELLDKW